MKTRTCRRQMFWTDVIRNVYFQTTENARFLFPCTVCYWTRSSSQKWSAWMLKLLLNWGHGQTDTKLCLNRDMSRYSICKENNTTIFFFGRGELFPTLYDIRELYNYVYGKPQKWSRDHVYPIFNKWTAVFYDLCSFRPCNCLLEDRP